MAVLGADPTELRGVAKHIRESQAKISEAGRRIGVCVRGSDWQGTDAQAFTADWRTHEANLALTARLLTEASAELERNAFEQADASASGAAPTARGELASASNSASPLLARMPTRTESYWINAGFAALFGIDGEARITIDYLPDGTAIVWLEGETGLTAAGGIGAQGGTDAGGIGPQASAFARAAESTRVGWQMDGDAVEEFIARAIASQAVDRATGDAFIPDNLAAGDIPLLGGLLPGFAKDANVESLLNPIGKRASEWFDSADVDVGEPDFREHMIGLEVGAGMDADLGLALAGAGVGGGLTAGIRSSPGGSRLVVKGSGTAEAKVAGRGYDGSVDREVELSVDDDGSTGLMITTTTRHGDHQTLTSETFEVSHGRRKDLLDAVNRGDVRAAGDELAGIAQSMGQPLDSATLNGDVNRDAFDDIGGEVSAGPKGELRGGVGREIVDYDR